LAAERDDNVTQDTNSLQRVTTKHKKSIEIM